MKSSNYLLVVATLACAYGCEPECREIEPVSEVREDFMEELDDGLDDLDVSDSQRTVIMDLGRQALKPIPAIRVVALPQVYEMTAELRKPKPSRKRLAQISEAMMEPYLRWFHNSVPLVMAAHQVLKPEQRAEAVEVYETRRDTFEGSWIMDRAVDYVLSDIKATKQQSALLKKIIEELINQVKVYERRMDGVRYRFAVEFKKDEPSVGQIHAALDLGYKHTRRLVFDVVGYYLYFAGELTPAQKTRLNRYLLFMEPCRKVVGKAN